MVYFLIWLVPGVAASAALSLFIELGNPQASSLWMFVTLFSVFALLAWVQSRPRHKLSPMNLKSLVGKIESIEVGVVSVNHGCVNWEIVSGELHLMVSGSKSMMVIFPGLHVDLESDPSDFCDAVGRILMSGGAVECSITPGTWELRLMAPDSQLTFRKELKTVTQDLGDRKAGSEVYRVVLPEKNG